jgi:3-hydroxybutyryl-CoA dehydratase
MRKILGKPMKTNKESSMSWEVGAKEELEVVVTDEKVRAFAELSGDKNPIHLDDEFAKNSIFKQRVAHGMLTASFISTFLAEKMPGPGAIYRKQNLKFVSPVPVGEKVKIVGTIKQINESRGVFVIDTTVYKEDGKVAIEGEATAMLRS